MFTLLSVQLIILSHVLLETTEQNELSQRPELPFVIPL